MPRAYHVLPFKSRSGEEVNMNALVAFRAVLRGFSPYAEYHIRERPYLSAISSNKKRISIQFYLGSRSSKSLSERRRRIQDRQQFIAVPTMLDQSSKMTLVQLDKLLRRAALN